MPPIFIKRKSAGNLGPGGTPGSIFAHFCGSGQKWVAAHGISLFVRTTLYMRGQTPTRPAKMGLACWPPPFSAPRKEAKRRQGSTPLETPDGSVGFLFRKASPTRTTEPSSIQKEAAAPESDGCYSLIYDHPSPVCIWSLQITGTVFIERKSRVPTLKRTPARPLMYRVIRAVPDGYGIHTFRRAPRKLPLGQKGGGPAGWFFGLSARSATSG